MLKLTQSSLIFVTCRVDTTLTPPHGQTDQRGSIACPGKVEGMKPDWNLLESTVEHTKQIHRCE